MNTSAKWDDDSRTLFADVMAEVVQSGVHTDSGFSKSNWTQILYLYNDRTSNEMSRSQLQNQHSTMKTRYKILATIIELSGFGWDHDRNLPTAPNDTWNRYIAAHPEAGPFRNIPFPQYEVLDTVFAGKCATGEFAQSSSTPSMPASTSSSSTSIRSNTVDPKVTPLKRTIELLNTDSDEENNDEGVQKDGVQKEGCRKGGGKKRGVIPPRPRPSKGGSAVKVANALELLAVKDKPIATALNLFSNNHSSNYSVHQRVQFKELLANEITAQLFIGLLPDERIEYVSSKVGAIMLPLPSTHNVDPNPIVDGSELSTPVVNGEATTMHRGTPGTNRATMDGFSDYCDFCEVDTTSLNKSTEYLCGHLVTICQGCSVGKDTSVEQMKMDMTEEEVAAFDENSCKLLLPPKYHGLCFISNQLFNGV